MQTLQEILFNWSNKSSLGGQTWSTPISNLNLTKL
jgi:hypothetical protein